MSKIIRIVDFCRFFCRLKICGTLLLKNSALFDILGQVSENILERRTGACFLSVFYIRGNMAKKIDVLGIGIDNYTVREELLLLDTFLSSTALNIIETVTVEKILLAENNLRMRECIGQADLTLIGDKELLEPREQVSVQRIREIKNNDFLYEMIRRVVRNQKRVFLLAMTRVEAEKMQAFFQAENPRFKIEGIYAVEECGTDLDTIVNEINGTTPDMVISSMTSPYEEEFILDHKDKLSLSIWLGIGADYNRRSEGLAIGSHVKSLALRGKLYHAMQKYQKESRENKK